MCMSAPKRTVITVNSGSENSAAFNESLCSTCDDLVAAEKQDINMLIL